MAAHGERFKKRIMKLGNWRVKNYWWKPSEQKRMNRIIKRLLANGWEFVAGGIDRDGNVYGTGESHYPGHDELQIQTLDGHNEI